MKTYNVALAAAGLVALLSANALADLNSVRGMGDGSQVSITGTVDRVKNEREFTLRDNSGSIDVDIESNQSVVLKQGDSVTVNGTVDRRLFGANINASRVTVNKNVAQAVSDAIEGHTPISFEGATPYDISTLPKQGLVKVSGTVTDVDNEKKFTVKDSTGSIKVKVESPETAALTKGAQVTVIGYVDNGLFRKDINARKVVVLADATSAR